MIGADDWPQLCQTAHAASCTSALGDRGCHVSPADPGLKFPGEARARHRRDRRAEGRADCEGSRADPSRRHLRWMVPLGAQRRMAAGWETYRGRTRRSLLIAAAAAASPAGLASVRGWRRRSGGWGRGAAARRGSARRTAPCTAPGTPAACRLISRQTPGRSAKPARS